MTRLDAVRGFVCAFLCGAPALAQSPIQETLDWDDPTDDLRVVCFAEGTDPAYMDEIQSMLPPLPEYFIGGTWAASVGSPTNLSWSLAPDGVNIPGLAGEPASANALFARLDNQFATQGGRATWIARIQACFDRWEALSGLDFTRVTAAGVDWDDGASWGTAGNDTTRGDIRISMHNIDSAGGILAYATYPTSADIVMDRLETWSAATNTHIFLRNVLTHELGHALGFDHVCSNNSNQLMEPFYNDTFDGPRQDDIRAVHRNYGDPFENDNSFGAATAVTLTNGVSQTFGTTPNPPTGTIDSNSSILSIDQNGEADWFKFTTANPNSKLDVTLTPVGNTYDDNAQSGSSCPSGASTNAKQQADLAVQVIGINGSTVIATAASAAIGLNETLVDVALSGAGTYYVKVYESATVAQSQLYRLTLRIDPASGCPDSDGDGVDDCSDGCPFDPLKITPGACGCGVPDTDTDNDGDADCVDNCPTVYNPAQADGDGDGVGNACDNCVTNFNPGQEDPDVDYLGSACDNCPNVSNAPQDDIDNDNVGDACDNCVALANPTQADCDLDNIGDVCEIAAGTQWDSNGNSIPDQCEPCGALTTYCTAGTTTNGCNATMSASGTPSLAATSGFVVSCSGVEGQKTGLLFYGITGPKAAPWAPGSTSYLCLKSPTQRTPSSNSGGTAGACDGAFSVDWLDYIATHPGALGAPFSAGAIVQMQAWFRDPPAPNTTNLSNGLQFTACP
ncbi:MAG: matrixin family metalloprotease [Planctomycetes bacterium]|nr:matrixin family metalloprotease [Planctomycetota bacterium]